MKQKNEVIWALVLICGGRFGCLVEYNVYLCPPQLEEIFNVWFLPLFFSLCSLLLLSLLVHSTGACALQCRGERKCIMDIHGDTPQQRMFLAFLARNSWNSGIQKIPGLNFQYIIQILWICKDKPIYFCLLSQVVYTEVTSACKMSWRQHWIIITIIKTSSNLKISTFMVKQRWWYLLPLQLAKWLLM